MSELMQDNVDMMVVNCQQQKKIESLEAENKALIELLIGLIKIEKA